MIGRSVDGGGILKSNFEYAEFLPYMLALPPPPQLPYQGSPP